MAKVVLSDVTGAQNQTSLAASINNNNDTIAAAIEKTLSRDGTTPNEMESQLDMNSYKIINVADGNSAGDAVNKSQLDGAVMSGVTFNDSAIPADLATTANTGTNVYPARRDHVHKLPTKNDIGLGNVDNTTDLSKPISTATQAALNLINTDFLNSLASREIDATEYGVVAALGVDSTTGLQAALDAAVAAGGGTVVLPSGYVKISSPVYITSNYVHLRGQGKGRTILYVTQGTTDGIVVGNPTVGVVYVNRIADMTIYSGATNPTGGALIHAVRTSNLTLENLIVQNGYKDIWLESTIHCNVLSCKLYIDGNMSAFTSGSAMVHISTYSGGAISSGIFFSDAEYMGATLNHYGEYGMLIEEVDTIWLYGYLGWTRYGLAIKPATTTSVIWSVNTSALYLDNLSFYGLYVKEPTGYSGYIGFCSLDLSTVHACQTGVVWDCTANSNNTIKNARLQIMTATGFELTKANNLSLINCSVEAANQGNINGSGVVVRAACTNIDIHQLVVRKTFGTYNTYRGLYVEDGATGIHATDMTFDNCDTDVLNSAVSTTTNKITDWKGDDVSPSVASASTIAFPGQDLFVITGTTGVTTIGGVAWNGRKVTFITTSGAVTFTAGTTIGNTCTTTANVPVTAVYLTSKWYIKV